MYGGYIEFPMIADFYEMAPDLQRFKRARPNRYHRYEANNQAIAVLNGPPCPGAPVGVGRGNGTLHEFKPECVKPLAGN
jgi:hypothetical protein